MGESDSQQPSRPLAETEFPAHPERIGPYRIEAQVGEGGMGRVYRAREQHPPREVALKLMRGLDSAGQLRFRREAELLAALEHPHIARLYAAGEADLGGLRMPWLAMEFVHGSDLVSHARAARLDLRARIRLLIEVVRAVHFAHGRGVIHRDLKPGNILVDAEGAPKILDFGVARLGDDEVGMTQQGQVLGTVPYMSPEQLAGRSREVDVRSDVYALGVIAYELIADRLPYPRLSTSSVMEALEIVQRQAPAELATLQPSARGDLNLVVMKALASEPARRYASAAEFAADLERVLDHRPVEARAPTVGYLISRFVRRNRALSAAALLVLAILLAATAVSLDFAFDEAQARSLADQRAAEAEAVTAFLEQMLASADPEQARGARLSVGDVLAVAARSLPQAELPDPVATRLLQVLGRAYLNLGEVDEALPLIEAGQTRAAGMGAAGEEARQAGEILLANADVARGQYPDAQSRVAALLAKPGTGAEIEVEARQVAAHVRVMQGSYVEAVQQLRSLIEFAGERLGPQHRATLTARHNLASTLQSMGRLDEALAEGESTYAVRREVLGETHPDTLHSLNLLSAVNHRLGQSELAEQQMRSLIDLRTQVVGADNPSTLITRRNLAVLMVQTGRKQEALDMLVELYADSSRAIGVTAPQTLSLTQLMAFVYSDLGRHQEAFELLRQTVDAQIAAGGPSEPQLLLPRNDLGMTLLDLGRIDEAIAEFEALIEWAQPMLDADDMTLAIFRSNYAESLLQARRFGEARAQLEPARAAFIAAVGQTHPRTVQAGQRLLRALEGLGQSQRAEAVRRELESPEGVG